MTKLEKAKVKLELMEELVSMDFRGIDPHEAILEMAQRCIAEINVLWDEEREQQERAAA